MTPGPFLTAWRWWLLACALIAPLAVVGAEVDRELGRPFLQNFALREYHAHNQNWATAQDAQGVLYFGNKAVVLEYDGVTWRKIHVAGTTYIRGLAIDASGIIYVGGVDQLGYLETSPAGDKTFVSLLDALPPDARDFKDIRRVYATPAGVFFAADQQLMRWRDGKFTIWKFPGTSRIRSHWTGEHLYLQQRDIGLQRMEGEQFVRVSVDPLLRDADVTFLTPLADGEILLGTADRGLFLLREGRTTPWPTEIDEFLHTKKITRGLRLHDGTIALATDSSGLVILTAQGQLKSRLDESSGLQNVKILGLFEGREHGLWLDLNSGLARLEPESVCSIFDTANGLPRATTRDLIRFRGSLFAATSGVYQLAPTDPLTAQAAHWRRLPGLEGEFWSLCPHESGLLVGGAGGVSLIANDNAVSLIVASSVQVLALSRSRVHPERVFLSTSEGLRSIRLEAAGQWIDEGPVPDFSAEVRTIVETGNGDLWLGTTTSGIYRVVFAPPVGAERGQSSVTQYFKTHGLPNDQQWTRVVPANDGTALFATQAGLYRFDPGTDTFHPVSEYGARFADGSFMLGAVAQDRTKQLWFAGRAPNGVWLDQELGHVSPNEPITGLPYKIADKIGEIEKFYPEGESAETVVWIGGTDGIVRVAADKLAAAPPAPAFDTIIRRAMTTGSAGSKAGPEPIGEQELLYERNSIRFEFAANTFSVGAAPRYQTRLAGFEGGEWSVFTPQTSVDYTNLPEGSYVFEVRARDIDGQFSSPARFPFSIAPPWQRTPLAYVSYALFALAALLGLARWQMNRFQRTHTRLESLIAARTGELRARESELLRAKETADTANRAKSSFLANMSHELRTPLNAILGYTQILLKDDTLSQKNRERLTVVGQSGGHLLAMINDVLDLSKIEAGKLTLNPTTISFLELIEEVCAAFRQRVAEKGLAFECAPPSDGPDMVLVDAGKLRQVLFNLLGNAVKFTETGGVSLHLLHQADGRVRFEVVDTGIGIAPDELRDIFLTFHQTANSLLAAQGAGLGLAISKQLVALLGGNLQVSSAPGEGSRFWFDLDLPKAETGGIPLTTQRDAVTGFRGRPRRLLIADDEETNRTVLRELLEPLGFEIEEAVDGGDCLDRCAATAFDALLLDLQMPTLDGFEVARTLRNSKSNGSLKIIAVSASVFEDDRQEAIDAGCNDFLAKPFEERQLLAVLGKALDLEWITAGPAPDGARATNEAAGLLAPPPEEIEAMLELSRRGDILGIKKRLAALAASDHGNYATFVQSLEPFVAAYQMNRIRDALLKLQKEKNP